MKPLINKAKSFLTGTVLFVFGVAMAGLGLATIGVLALLALSAVGVALLASPFVAATHTRNAEVSDTATTA